MTWEEEMLEAVKARDFVKIQEIAKRYQDSIMAPEPLPVTKPRYFVDKRCGCIAVRDSLKTKMDEPGLERDTEGVVWYRLGEQVNDPACVTCGHIPGKRWVIPEGTINEAEKLCWQFNNSGIA